MIKKRAMAEDRWITDMSKQCIDEINVKRLEPGYADNQPKWPYWVRPYNYSAPEWLEMNVWMLEIFGNCNWHTENARWVGSDRKYWFRDERDRTMFLLRWS